MHESCLSCSPVKSYRFSMSFTDFYSSQGFKKSFDLTDFYVFFLNLMDFVVDRLIAL